MLADKLCTRFQTYVLRKYSKMRGAILSLYIVLGLGFSGSTIAQSSFSPELKNNVGTYKLDARQIKRLSGRICGTLTDFAARDHDISMGDKIEEYLLKYSGVDRSLTGYKARLAEFWNTYSSDIICRANGSNSFPKQHFFSRAIIHDFPIWVFKDYFFNDSINFPIDPNVITVNQYGQKETILDYIDRVLSDPDAADSLNDHHIKEIRDIIENDFGGKRVRELP